MTLPTVTSPQPDSTPQMTQSSLPIEQNEAHASTSQTVTSPQQNQITESTPQPNATPQITQPSLLIPFSVLDKEGDQDDQDDRLLPQRSFQDFFNPNTNRVDHTDPQILDKLYEEIEGAPIKCLPS